MNLNKAMLIGNLTRDPEVRTTPQGTSVTSFSVATNHVWKDAAGVKQEKVEYHNIVAWSKLAEIIGQYCRKGSKVYVEGRLQTREWTGQDGAKRKSTEIVAENLIMLDSKGAGGARPMAAKSSDVPVIDAETPAGPAPKAASDDEIKLEDIPF